MRLGHKTKNALRLGAKVAIGVGALLGAKHEGDKFISSEQDKQRGENQSVLAGVAKDLGERGTPRTEAAGSSIVKKTTPVITGAGHQVVPPPPPLSKTAMGAKVVGVMVGGASLKDELISAGQDYHQRSLSREEQEKRLRESQQKTARSGTTVAQGGVGSTDASVKELAKIGKRKAKKKLTPKKPKNPFKYHG